MARPKGSFKKPDENQLVHKLALLGATNVEIAEAFGVTPQTIDNWFKKKKGFFDAVNAGRMMADAHVAEALYHRALGYSHPEEKIFNHNGEILRAETEKHYPPDTAAAFIWLKNRRPGDWRRDSAISIDEGAEVESVTIKMVDGSSDKRQPASS